VDAIDALDQVSLLELSRRTDAHGVLSVYFDADPSTSPNLEGAAIDLRNRLRELENNVDESVVPRRILAAAMERLRPSLDALVDPRATGRGRVLYAAIADGWTVQLAGQLPLRNRVVLEDGPFIHPLLEVLDEGRPAGVLVVSGVEARLFDWRVGVLHPVGDRQQPYVEAPHERAGQVGGGPGGQYNSPMREQRQARGREHAERFLQQIAREAVGLSEQRGWGRLLVVGGERWTAPVVELLGGGRAQVLSDTRVLTGSTDGEIATMVTERLHDAHAEQEAQLLLQVREAAASGAGAAGASQVAAALNEGRVTHLVYDPQIRYQGLVGADGLLYAGDEGPTDDPRLAREPRLTERLVERALETGARVSPVEGAASGPLEDAEGIAALLRW
jgi:hypothetical protein